MTAHDFDQTLRSLISRDPFEPFVVELRDGTAIPVRRPDLAFGGGASGFIGDDGGLVDFSWDQVREIRTAAAGIAHDA